MINCDDGNSLKVSLPSISLSSVDLLGIKFNDIPYFSFKGINTICKVIHVYDGDTFSIIFNPPRNTDNEGYEGGTCNDDNTCKLGSTQSIKIRCRLGHIDTPEMRTDKIKAMKSRNRLVQLCTNISIEIDDVVSTSELNKRIDNENTLLIQVNMFEFDKYGRLIVDVFTKDNESISSIMILEGYGYPYEGGTKKKITEDDS